MLLVAIINPLKADERKGNRKVKSEKTVSKKRTITNDFVVNKGTNNFQQRSAANTDNCGSTATLHCVYQVTTSGKANIPNNASYTAAQINNYVSNGWLTAAPNSSPALYIE
jgi:hypothetical protein